MVKLRCQILKNNLQKPFMSIVNTLALESNRQIKINFDGGDLSSDAGLLLKNAEMIIDGYFYISMTIIGLLLDYEIQEYFLHFSTY